MEFDPDAIGSARFRRLVTKVSSVHVTLTVENKFRLKEDPVEFKLSVSRSWPKLKGRAVALVFGRKSSAECHAVLKKIWSDAIRRDGKDFDCLTPKLEPESGYVWTERCAVCEKCKARADNWLLSLWDLAVLADAIQDDPLWQDAEKKYPEFWESAKWAIGQLRLIGLTPSRTR